MSVFRVGSVVRVQPKSGTVAFGGSEFTIQELIGTADSNPEMVLLCDIAALGNFNL
ncbi:hypothetical protein ACSVDA_15705 [Cytobacillus sp. Hm23]